MRSACKKLCLRCGLLAQVLLHRPGKQLAAGLRTALGDRLLRTPASLDQDTPGPGTLPVLLPRTTEPKTRLSLHGEPALPSLVEGEVGRSHLGPGGACPLHGAVAGGGGRNHRLLAT